MRELATADTPTLTEVVDSGALGPEPSESYLQSLDMLDNVTRECIFVSRGYGGIPSPTGRHFYASVLFTAMITRCVSLVSLAPHSPWAAKLVEHWDYSSMTGIARTIIELRVAFYYLCVDECSDEEWYFRWNLFNLHNCTSCIRMFDALGDAEQVKGFEAQAEELRGRLRTSPFWATLDPKRHKRLLHGQTAYLFPLEVIAERAGIDTAVFRWLYVLFSSHVHGLPMSFYRIGGDNPEGGRGLPSASEEGYSALCLTLSATLLVKTRDEIHVLFDGLMQSNSQPPFTETKPEDSQDLAIGDDTIVDVSKQLSLQMHRIDENETLMRYICRETGENVLERAEFEDGSAELRYFDPFFWTIRLNGASTTETQLEQALTLSHAYRIDHEARELLFKTSTKPPSKAATENVSER